MNEMQNSTCLYECVLFVLSYIELLKIIVCMKMYNVEVEEGSVWDSSEYMNERLKETNPEILVTLPGPLENYSMHGSSSKMIAIAKSWGSIMSLRFSFTN